jgi:hypothetical protein
VNLIQQRAAEIKENAIVSQDGREFPVDAICFATGYKVTEHLASLDVRGVGGKKLSEVWNADEGSHAYHTVSVSGFPNFALLFGPNGFPSNNSCIYHSEIQVENLERILLRPILTERSCRSIDVKRQVEVAWYTSLRKRLAGMVWSSGCGNYQRNQWGHNTSNYPYSSVIFRRHLLLTPWSSYQIEGASLWWSIYRTLDYVLYWPWALVMGLLCTICNAMERAVPLL